MSKRSNNISNILEITDFSLQDRNWLLEGRTGMELTIPNLVIKPGTVSALIGRSGCGKSVLLCTLMGYPPFGIGGRVRGSKFNLFERRLSPGSFKFRSLLDAKMYGIMRYGALIYLPQSFPPSRGCALKTRTALLQILEAQLKMSGIKGENAEAILEDEFRNVGLSSLLDKSLSALSGGERRRAELATRICAIKQCKKPTLLLLDEPTTGFDAKSAMDFMRWLCERIRELPKETIPVAALVSTHNLECLDKDSGNGGMDSIVLAHRDFVSNNDGYNSSRCAIIYSGEASALPHFLGIDDGFGSFAHDGYKIFDAVNKKSTTEWMNAFYEMSK